MELNYRKNYLNSKLGKFNGVTAIEITSTQSNSTIPMYIFAGNLNGIVNYYAKMRLYDLRVSSGSTLTANFVPCRRKTDGAVGLCDTIGGGFYTNSGSGTFISGPIIQ